jgi:chromate transport protein ChrA
MKGVVSSGVDAVIFLLSFAVLFTINNKFTQPLVILTAAITGQTIYL